MTNHLYQPDDFDREHPVASICARLVGFIVAILILTLLGSCRTPCNITEMDNIHDTCFITKYNHDSIYQHDSIVIREFVENDTFHVEQFRYKTLYRDKVSHDTIYIHKVDTITKTVIQEKQENMITKFKNGFVELMEVAAILTLAFIGFMMVFWWRGK